MNQAHYYIKNMVCPRCIQAVKEVLLEMEVPYREVALGKVELDSELSLSMKTEFGKKLETMGFELLEESKSQLISRIKSILLQQIQHTNSQLGENYSSFISEKLNHEYTYLSKLFSQVEGITIEKYITKLKIERVKELISYQEKTLSEIADLLGYSSVAYLSAQFKKETGMSPSEFKKQGEGKRKGLDKV